MILNSVLCSPVSKVKLVRFLQLEKFFHFQSLFSTMGVCLFLSLSVCLSIALLYCIKTVQARITKTFTVGCLKVSSLLRQNFMPLGAGIPPKKLFLPLLARFV